MGSLAAGKSRGKAALYFFCFFDFSSRKFLLLTSNVRSSPSGISIYFIHQRCDNVLVRTLQGPSLGRGWAEEHEEMVEIQPVLEVVHLTENHQPSCDSPVKTEVVNWTSFSPLHPYLQVIQFGSWGFKRHLNSLRTPETHSCITVTGPITLRSSQMLVVSSLVGQSSAVRAAAQIMSGWS